MSYLAIYYPQIKATALTDLSVTIIIVNLATFLPLAVLIKPSNFKLINKLNQSES